jgi:topoisomerase-4 subunit B
MDGSVSIDDDGRGIPFGMHPKKPCGSGWCSLTFAVKFDKGKAAQLFSGGLHGVGVSVTNALSASGGCL